MQLRRVLPLLAVLALLAAACNDDGSTTLTAETTTTTEATTTSTTTTTTTEPTTTTTEPTTTTAALPPASDDQAAAQAAVDAVVAEFEGQGFEVVPPREQGGTDEMPFTSPECREFGEAFAQDDDSLPGETAHAEAELSAGGNTPTDPEHSVEVSVSFVEDPTELDQLLDLASGPQLEQCMQEAFTEGLAADEDGPSVELDDFEIERFEPRGGDSSLGLRLSGSLGIFGVDFPFSYELQLVRSGRAAISISTGAFGSEEVEVDGAAVLDLVLTTLSE